MLCSKANRRLILVYADFDGESHQIFFEGLLCLPSQSQRRRVRRRSGPGRLWRDEGQLSPDRARSPLCSQDRNSPSTVNSMDCADLQLWPTFIKDPLPVYAGRLFSN